MAVIAQQMPNRATCETKGFEFVDFGVLLLLMKLISSPGSAQSPSGEPNSQSSNERVFENKTPKDLPFKIKMKKEKEESYKDLKNDNWLREFELELTNTGDKPI